MGVGDAERLWECIDDVGDDMMCVYMAIMMRCESGRWSGTRRVLGSWMTDLDAADHDIDFFFFVFGQELTVDRLFV